MMKIRFPWEILEEYWSIIDPTVLNRQGNDVGSQYRTGIYYLDEDNLDIILKSKEEEQKNTKKNCNWSCSC